MSTASKRPKSLYYALMAVVLFVLGASVAAASCDLYLDASSATYPASDYIIEQVLAAGFTGPSTVCLSPGTFVGCNQSLTIDGDDTLSAFQLTGQGKNVTVLDCAGGGPLGSVVDAGALILTNMTIMNAATIPNLEQSASVCYATDGGTCILAHVVVYSCQNSVVRSDEGSILFLHTDVYNTPPLVTTHIGVVHANDGFARLEGCVFANFVGAGVVAISDAVVEVEDTLIEKSVNGTGINVRQRVELTVRNTTVRECVYLTPFSDEEAQGGGIYIGGVSTGAIHDSVVYGNTALDGGGIVCYVSLQCLVNNTLIENNLAVASGGGVAVLLAEANVYGCVLRGNVASTGFGGGVLSLSGGLNLLFYVSDTTFDGNVAVVSGGGGYAALGKFDVENCMFVNNVGVSGGGILTSDVDGEVRGGLMSGNGAVYGGGILITEGDVAIDSVRFTDNTATTYNGGALALVEYAMVNVTRCEFVANTGISGGAISAEGSGSAQFVYVYDCVFERNSATSVAGAIYTSSAAVLAEYSTFLGNSAPDGGCFASLLSSSAIGVFSCLFEENSNGVILSLLGDSVVSYNSVFHNNTGSLIDSLNSLTLLHETVAVGNECPLGCLSITGSTQTSTQLSTVLDSFVSLNEGVGMICGDATVAVFESTFCGNSDGDRLCQGGCDVISNTGPGSSYPTPLANDTVSVCSASGKVSYTDCEAACSASGFCVTEAVKFVGPYDGCHTCDGSCDTGNYTCPTAAHCVDSSAVDYVCGCDSGYVEAGPGVAVPTKSPNCTDVDECLGLSPAYCGAAGVCVNTVGSFYCDCSTGYAEPTGSSSTTSTTTTSTTTSSSMFPECQDIDECTDGLHTCADNATCVNTAGSFTCFCKKGYYGSGLECTQCPEQSTTAAVGAGNVTDCACVAGSFRVSGEGPADACGPCPVGMFLAAPTICLPCQKNQYNDEINIAECKLCPTNAGTAGTRSSSPDNCTCISGFDPVPLPDSVSTSSSPLLAAGFTCERYCPPGSSRPSPTAECVVCGTNSYTDSPNSPACVACPNNAESPENSTTIMACTCRRHYYTVERRAGEACIACPEGAKCKGGLSWPIAARGYYAVDTARGDAAEFGACVPKEACLGGTQCGEGYEGEFCAKCEDGFFRLSGRCRPCRGSPVAIVNAGAIAVWVLCALLVWFNTQERAVNRFASLVIGLNSLQITAIYGRLDIDWPSLAQSFFDTLSVANFNIELVSPECAILSARPFYLRWLSTVFLPAILALYFVTIYGLGHAALALKSAVQLDRLPFVIPTYVTPRYLRHTCLRAYFQVMTFIYLPLVATVCEYFNCVPDPSGKTMVIASSRQTPCYDTFYWSLSPLAIALCILYPLGMPAALGALLHSKRKGLGPMKFALRYGFVVGRYRDELYLYELAVMMRKLGVVIAMAFFTRSPYVKAVGAAIVLGTTLGIHIHLRPYVALVYNAVETICVASAIIVLLLGTLFLDNTLPSDLLNGSVIAVLLVNMIAIAAALGFDAWRLASEEADAEEDDIAFADPVGVVGDGLGSELEAGSGAVRMVEFNDAYTMSGEELETEAYPVNGAGVGGKCGATGGDDGLVGLVGNSEKEGESDVGTVSSKTSNRTTLHSKGSHMDGEDAPSPQTAAALATVRRQPSNFEGMRRGSGASAARAGGVPENNSQVATGSTEEDWTPPIRPGGAIEQPSVMLDSVDGGGTYSQGGGGDDRDYYDDFDGPLSPGGRPAAPINSPLGVTFDSGAGEGMPSVLGSDKSFATTTALDTGATGLQDMRTTKEAGPLFRYPLTPMDGGGGGGGDGAAAGVVVDAELLETTRDMGGPVV